MWALVLGVFAFGDHRAGDHSAVVGLVGPGHAVSVDGSDARAGSHQSAPTPPGSPSPADPVVTAGPGGDPLRLDPWPAGAVLVVAALVVAALTGIAATATTVTADPATAARRRTRSSTTLSCVAQE